MSAISLAEDIAVRALLSGMMKEKSEKEIKKQIELFLTPEKTKTHGRPISREEAATCGLIIESKDVKEGFWKLAYELYIRTDNFVSQRAAKCIESKEHSFSIPAPQQYEGA
jgi:hypothetical protein